MLKYKVGDLIGAAQEGCLDVIGHQCNCYCTMGSGIAPKIKEAFPEAYEADLETEKGDRDKLGSFSYAKINRWPQSDLLVFNLYGQYNYGKGLHTDYEALRSAISLMSTALSCTKSQNESGEWCIGLPLLGCGLGGGDWKIVEQIIIEELVNNNHDVTIYVLSKDDIPDWRK